MIRGGNVEELNNGPIYSGMQSLNPHQIQQRQESLKSLSEEYLNANQSQKSYSKQNTHTAQLGNVNETHNSRFAKVSEVGVGRRSLAASSHSRTNQVASVSGFSFQNIGQSMNNNF